MEQSFVQTIKGESVDISVEQHGILGLVFLFQESFQPKRHVLK
jgi:hypothetical protein